MEKKENSDLIGKICYFYGTIVLVVSTRTRFIDDIKVTSYDILFPDGGVDTTNSKSLKIIS